MTEVDAARRRYTAENTPTPRLYSLLIREKMLEHVSMAELTFGLIDYSRPDGIIFCNRNAKVM